MFLSFLGSEKITERNDCYYLISYSLYYNIYYRFFIHLRCLYEYIIYMELYILFIYYAQLLLIDPIN